MRILSCMFMMAACLGAQDTVKKTTAPAAKQTQKPPARLTVPDDAVETSPGLYRWTDKDGKVWMYRRSPFGVSRFPAEPGDMKPQEAKEQSSAQRVTAVEEGDSIRFEQNTPFGKRTWTRKKAELSESEKTIWEQQQQKKSDVASRAADKE